MKSPLLTLFLWDCLVIVFRMSWLKLRAIYSPKYWYQYLLCYLSAGNYYFDLDHGFRFLRLLSFLCLYLLYLCADISLISAVVDYLETSILELQNVDFRLLALPLHFSYLSNWDDSTFFASYV